MTPRIEELLDYLARERAYLSDVIQSVPDEHAEVKPSPEVWCVSDVVQHLALSERRMIGMLSKAIDDARAQGVKPDGSSDPVLSGIDVSRILDRTTKIRNPRGDPAGAKPLGEAIEELDAVRYELEMLLQADQLPDLTKISAPHPAFGPLNGYQWVAFAGAHMHRHADQIREIALSLAAK